MNFAGVIPGQLVKVSRAVSYAPCAAANSREAGRVVLRGKEWGGRRRQILLTGQVLNVLRYRCRGE